ncbi:TIGR02391 family protein [Kitasatospora sp. NPDC093558]|uniref:TIGR02391 family protein n=1 Tax=Kitasatospora sp. NPDC093558 TaxID=3155201 RepID=UPI003433742A
MQPGDEERRGGESRSPAELPARQSPLALKVGRRDASEMALFQSVFSKDAPKPGQSRLRLMPDDGSDTFRSVRRGVAAFAEGAFAAIRNPNSHEAGLPELPEHLGVFSTLARWVDTAALAL